MIEYGAFLEMETNGEFPPLRSEVPAFATVYLLRLLASLKGFDFDNLGEIVRDPDAVVPRKKPPRTFAQAVRDHRENDRIYTESLKAMGEDIGVVTRRFTRKEWTERERQRKVVDFSNETSGVK